MCLTAECIRMEEAVFCSCFPKALRSTESELYSYRLWKSKLSTPADSVTIQIYLIQKKINKSDIKCVYLYAFFNLDFWIILSNIKIWFCFLPREFYTSFLSKEQMTELHVISVASVLWQFPSVQISNSHLVPRIWFICQSSFMRCFCLTLILDNTPMGWADGVAHLLLQGMRKSERSQGRDGTIATFFPCVKGPVFLVNLVGNTEYRLLGELADYCK